MQGVRNAARGTWTRGIYFLVLPIAIAAAWPTPVFAAEPAAERTPELAEWESLNYGMFIHFGMSTFTADEFDPGEKPSTTYAPTALDVDQWICAARDAGMKYAVLTAKHVSGHCLWDSKVSWKGKEYDYDVATSSNPTDVVAAFMKACKKYDVQPGIYYCIWDRHNQARAEQKTDGAGPEYFDLVKGHMAELHTRYPGIREQWIDIPWYLTAAQRRELYDLIKRHSPACLVLMNNGYHDGSEAIRAGCWPSDLINGEVTIPPPSGHDPVKKFDGKTYYQPMEVCEVVGKHWFYIPGDVPKPPSALHLLYRNSVERGANLLLDVGPDRSGRVPDDQVEALVNLKRAIDHPDKFPASITLGKKVAASRVYENDPRYAATSAVDDDYGTRWAAPEGATSAWFEVDLGLAMTFDRAVLVTPVPPEFARIRAFQIEYFDEGQWKVGHKGGSVSASGLEVSFKPVTAQRVRLNITEATNGPTLSEFQLFAPAKR
ncbi:MAG: alpha-L-fucosidase [Pirellulales bacterium]|nr:alpha-L-fucosidase [Pirellulales bacterium]